MRFRSFRRLPTLTRLLLTGVLLMLVSPLVGLAQQADEFESDLDGAWTGRMEVRGSTDVLLMQLNLNVEEEGGTAVLITHDPKPDTLKVIEARIDEVTDTSIILDYDDDGGDDGDSDDGDSDDGDGDDGDSDDEPGGMDDDFYAPDSTDVEPESKEVFGLSLEYDPEEDTLFGNLRGDRRGKVTLHRIGLGDRPLQRMWAVRLGQGGDERLLLMQLMEEAESAGRFAATQVTGDAWVGNQQGSVTGERNNKDVDLTIDLGGEQIELSLKLRRNDNQLRGQVTTADGNSNEKILPVGSNNGKPMKLRRANPRKIDADVLTLVTVKGKNFGRGVTVHSGNTHVKVISVDLVNPRTLSVLLDVASSAAGERIALRAVNGDGQEHRRNNRLVINDGGGDDGDDGDDDGGDDGAGVSFSGDVAPIFAANCALAGCHNAATASEGLVLESNVAFGNIVDVASNQRPSFDRIEPGDPDNSYLIMKIRGDGGIQGGRMPLSRAPLSQAQIDTIVSWVEAGAPNNLPVGGQE